jgi:hypothetical protein
MRPAAYGRLRDGFGWAIIVLENIDMITSSLSGADHPSSDAVTELTVQLRGILAYAAEDLQNCFGEGHPLSSLLDLGIAVAIAGTPHREGDASRDVRSPGQVLQAAFHTVAERAAAVPEAVQAGCPTIERLSRRSTLAEDEVQGLLDSLREGDVRSPGDVDTSPLFPAVASAIERELDRLELDRSLWSSVGSPNPGGEEQAGDGRDTDQGPPGGGPTNPQTPGQIRDMFIYEQCIAGVAYASIRRAVNEGARQEGWDRLDTDNGVREAARRYADRHKLQRPPKRRQFGNR